MELTGHSSRVRCVALSNDGRRIVTGSDDETARVWDVSSGQMLLELKGHSGPILIVTLSADGRQVVTEAITEQGQEIWVWDLETGKRLDEPIPKLIERSNRLPDGRLVIPVGNRIVIFDPTVPPDEITRRCWFLRPDPAYHVEQRQLCEKEKNDYAAQVHRSLEQRAYGILAADAHDYNHAYWHFVAAALLKPPVPASPEIPAKK